MSPYTWKPLTIVCASMMIAIDRACDSSLLHARQLGLEIHEIKNTQKISFQVFGANPRNIVPAKISMYTVHTRTHVHSHIHTDNTRMHTHILINTYTHTHTHTHMHIHTLTSTHTRTHTCTHAHTQHARMHARTRTHPHTHPLTLTWCGATLPCGSTP